MLILCTAVSEKYECIGVFDGNRQREWSNPPFNFDHILNAFLALFVTATFEGTTEILYNALDATGVDMQPRRNANNWAILYFLTFIFIGAMVALNLFVGVVVDSFQQLEKKLKCPVLLTESQQQWYATAKAALQSKPKRVQLLPRPANAFRQRCYDLVSSVKFELVIMGIILVLIFRSY